MRLATRNGRDTEVRVAEFGSSAIPSPAMAGGQRAYSGSLVTTDEMFGLAVASACIRLIAELIASLPLTIYRGEGAAKEPVPNAWQATLLNQYGNQDQSPFELITDLAAGPEGYGNGYAQKIKDRAGRVVELIPMDPDKVRVARNRNTGAKEFHVWDTDNGQQKVMTPSQVFHLRGWTPKGGLAGFSPVGYHRHEFGNALALVQYLGKIFANDASVPFALAVPGTLTKTQAKEVLEIWMDTHGGLSNKGKPAILSGGSTIEHVGMNLVDAAYLQVADLSDKHICALYGVPASILGLTVERGSAMTAEQESARLLRFCIMRRLVRFESALRTDPDLFPPNRPEYPQFDTTELLRADALGQAQAILFLRQGGILVADEGRAILGYGPLPDGQGQIPQLVPVGGGENPAPHNTPPGSKPDPADQADNN